MVPDSSLPLRRALWANAVFSGLSGLAALAAAEPLGAWLGLASPMVLRVLGVGLLLFAADLVSQARAEPIEPNRAVMASGADVLWVVGTIVLLVFFPGLLSVPGRWIVAAVGAVVAGCAAGQAAGLMRLEPTHDEPTNEIRADRGHRRDHRSRPPLR